MNDKAIPRLSALAHGGGCGCKIAPGVLAQILQQHQGALPPQLLVGIETSDDAAVWQLNAQQALIATTDFFMPVVDDARDFGRIAATNALSDVYAMGGQPIFALAIVGMPINTLPLETIGAILRGGEEVCREAGIIVAGGHSIDSVEPIYGLVALGLAHPEQIKRNSSAQAGDYLVLGKPLGVGVYSAALKKEALNAAGYAQMIDSTTRLNTPGPLLAQTPGVHAITDVTGFGLAGHVLEMLRPQNLHARIDWAALPWLPQAQELAQAGYITGASRRNLTSCQTQLAVQDGFAEWQTMLLTDPQTSGGLLVACDEQALPKVQAIFAQQGFAQAGVIGRIQGAGESARLELA
ncbi:selenide, water dikinase SelD [Massilia sp. W12]|uniref:selenide, water dikinase SelD n=1 Tax=Massilia sp. W12 TaxID=3126507 RepID=UPI0030D46577